MAQPDYIFIVGMDRTGTTLTRHILNRSDAIGLAAEAHYFRGRPHSPFLPDDGYRGLFRKIADLSTEDGAKKVVNYLFGDPTNFPPFWRFSKKDFDREEFLCKLLNTDRSERALLDLALQFNARGKPIRGEKTPSNVYFIPTIMKWFPNAKIIHTFRDPRAVYVSRKNKKEKQLMSHPNRRTQKTGLMHEFYASNRVILSWQLSTGLLRRYQDKYPGRYHLSKYEDLISDPKSAIQNLCHFLEVEFITEMLQPTITNSSLVAGNQFQGGFDTSAINRWRKHIHPLINNWITFCCKKQLLEFGYQL